MSEEAEFGFEETASWMFCTCVDGDTVWPVIMEALQTLKDGKDIRTVTQPECATECHTTYTYLLLSLMHRGKIIEHGSSIRCSWLTPRGEEFLRILQEWYAEHGNFEDLF